MMDYMDRVLFKGIVRQYGVNCQHSAASFELSEAEHKKMKEDNFREIIKVYDDLNIEIRRLQEIIDIRESP